MNCAVASLGLLCFGLAPSVSRADVQNYTTFGSFNSALPSGVNVDNVLFNSGLTTQGTTVFGETKSGLILGFTSILGNQVFVVNTGTGGQAKINPFGTTTFADIVVNPAISPLPNTGSLAAISFNVQTLNTTDTFLVSGKALSSTGAPETFSFTYKASNGNQEVGLIAFNGESITQVTVSKLTGALVGINNVGEFRIAPGTPKVVPEPTTLSMAGTGICLASLAVYRSRQRRAKASTI